jgi:hypothetical protein
MKQGICPQAFNEALRKGNTMVSPYRNPPWNTLKGSWKRWYHLLSLFLVYSGKPWTNLIWTGASGSRLGGPTTKESPGRGPYRSWNTKAVYPEDQETAMRLERQWGLKRARWELVCRKQWSLGLFPSAWKGKSNIYWTPFLYSTMFILVLFNPPTTL